MIMPRATSAATMMIIFAALVVKSSSEDAQLPHEQQHHVMDPHSTERQQEWYSIGSAVDEDNQYNTSYFSMEDSTPDGNAFAFNEDPLPPPDDIRMFMRQAWITRISIQTMVNETLVLSDKVVSLADSNLEELSISSRMEQDGPIMFQSLVDDYPIRTLKRDGVVRSVTKTFEGKEKITAELLPGSTDQYAVYSTTDLDARAIEKLDLDIDSLIAPPPDEETELGDNLVIVGERDEENDLNEVDGEEGFMGDYPNIASISVYILEEDDSNVTVATNDTDATNVTDATNITDATNATDMNVTDATNVTDLMNVTDMNVTEDMNMTDVMNATDIMMNTNHTPLDDTPCSSYRIVRIDARYDSDFCNSYAGKRGAVDRIHAIVAEVDALFRPYPLCVKVQTCMVDGHCNRPGEEDPLQKLMTSSPDMCYGKSPFIHKFKLDVYATRHKYRGTDMQCDVTHAFFGNSSYDRFPKNSVGCAFNGNVCNLNAVGVSQAGQFTHNLAAQAALIAHEVAHNLKSGHDKVYGGGKRYLMDGRNLCLNCDEFSPESIKNMTEFVKKQTSCLGLEIMKSNKKPNEVEPPRTKFKPNPRPTRLKRFGDMCLGRFLTKKSCHKRSRSECTWRNDLKQCWRRENMKCSDYDKQSRCLTHGSNCVWGHKSKKCDNVCSVLKGDSCDASPYCTWRSKNKACQVRHKIKCKGFKDEHRCLNHGSFCEWDSADRSCTDTFIPPHDPDACSGIMMKYFCGKDRFRLCTWNNKLDKCDRRDSMPCHHFEKQRSCIDQLFRCQWNKDEKTCGNKFRGRGG